MPPTEKRAQVDGLDIFYAEAGDGPPVLLIHGFPVSSRIWSQVIGPLSQAHRVIAVDVPGFGESACPPAFSYDFVGFADAIAGFLAQVGAKPAAIVGHSMGGAIALATTVLHPGSASRLVLVDALAYPKPLPLEGRLALMPIVGPFLFKKLYRKANLMRFFRRDVYVDPAKATEEMVDYFWKCLERPGGKEAAYRTLCALGDVEPIAELPPRVACPSFIVWGEGDKVFPLAHGERLAREIPGARLEVIRGAGHSPIDERAEDFLARGRPFLAPA